MKRTFVGLTNEFNDREMDIRERSHLVHILPPSRKSWRIFSKRERESERERERGTE